MTKENGTPSKKRKQVRLDDEVTVLGTKPTAITPSVAATSLVSMEVASYPDPIQALTKSIAQKFNALKSKQRQQTLSIAKLAESSFIPSSLRIQVTLTAPASVSETDTFKKHKSNMDAALKLCQQACKQSILETAKLVDEDMKTSTGKLLLEGIINLCTLFAITLPDNKNAHRLAYYLTETHLAASIFTSTWTTRLGIMKLIQEDDPTSMAYEIIDDDDPTPVDAPVTQATNWTFTDVEKDNFNQVQPSLCAILLAIFVNSWKAQLKMYDRKDIEMAMAVAAKKIMGNDATHKAAQIVDAEPSVGPQVMAQLIDTAVNKKTKPLEVKITKLTEKVQREKNSNRGTKKPASSKPATGAPSTKNKNVNGKGKKGENAAASKKGRSNKSPSKPRGRSPASSDTALRADNKKKSPQRGRSPANKKRPPSNRGSNKN
jgi:hypothetical protein